MDAALPCVIMVEQAESGERLDRVLAARVPSVSRATFQRWVDEGRVSVDGAAARVSAKVRAGQRIAVHPGPPPSTDALPQDIPLVILFEDADLLVVDKPAGLVVHPAAGHPDGTLVNAILHHTRIEDADASVAADADSDADAAADTDADADADAEADADADAAASADAHSAPRRAHPPQPRPGIVHRLDKDTSGVMVVAKTVRAREVLVRAFAAHDLERMYVAIAVGAPPDVLTLDTLHARHPSDRKRFTTKTSRGKRAVTHLRVRERLHGAALVECRLETGRTHQIRVHLADAGFPLLGDPVYGKPPRDARLRAAATTLARQALHAQLLAFAHPVTGAPLRFETAPPNDFIAALAALRG